MLSAFREICPCSPPLAALQYQGAPITSHKHGRLQLGVVISLRAPSGTLLLYANRLLTKTIVEDSLCDCLVSSSRKRESLEIKKWRTIDPAEHHKAC